MNYTTSQAFKDARLVGGIQAFYQTPGAGLAVPFIEIYDGVQPAGGAAPSGNNLLALALLQPAVSLVAHQLVILQGDPSGDLVTTQGSATWGRLRNAHGDWMLDGDMVAAGSGTPGVFTVQGTIGTLLYLGARAILGTTVIA